MVLINVSNEIQVIACGTAPSSIDSEEAIAATFEAIKKRITTSSSSPYVAIWIADH